MRKHKQTGIIRKNKQTSIIRAGIIRQHMQTDSLMATYWSN